MRRLACLPAGRRAGVGNALRDRAIPSGGKSPGRAASGPAAGVVGSVAQAPRPAPGAVADPGLARPSPNRATGRFTSSARKNLILRLPSAQNISCSPMQAKQETSVAMVTRLPAKIPRAPVEQDAVAEVLRVRYAGLAALGQRRERTRALKRATTPELPTGKTRVV